MFFLSGLINLCCFLSFPLFSVVSACTTSIDFRNSSGSEEVRVVVMAEQGARSKVRISSFGDVEG